MEDGETVFCLDEVDSDAVGVGDVCDCGLLIRGVMYAVVDGGDKVMPVSLDDGEDVAPYLSVGKAFMSNTGFIL